MTVCPFTSAVVVAPLLRGAVTPDDRNGLDHTSFLMIDKITTARISNTGEVVGSLETATMVEFERRLLVFLGFGG